MNRYRTRHPDYAKKAGTTYGELTDDAAASGAAENVYTEAEKHRQGVIARDKARKKGARRG
jgi:hypothetical protein